MAGRSVHLGLSNLRVGTRRDSEGIRTLSYNDLGVARLPVAARSHLIRAYHHWLMEINPS
jgi:hypothetical protein